MGVASLLPPDLATILHFRLTLNINIITHSLTFNIFPAATISTQGYVLNTYLGPYVCV